ncbi:hypothetical protein BKA82DRAFT_130576 [Pisolithus tinctorius]|uniref:Csf1 N-terminal domain-containing protein n=1 Tax=Pisolithus tinctorius Marx 270 TaxID=870435 RepID=A0A0C3KKM3_PISTI|nr:hypothetical protein BKA82DRAFT_130576 [Pisolithus tinctorius]KIO10152.1 hypothetical protein M404DRAFT_130576 [Pisolithus tinctorius Marx 270]
MLNIYLLVSCICVLVASILYTFYWNRFFAALIGLFLRIRCWDKQGSSIWVQIGEAPGVLADVPASGSIHFSLLAGRILLKDVRYHSSNQTISVVKAQITWRYWLRATATEDDLDQEHVGGEDFNQPRTLPPCRVKISVHGFEWFLYNKTAAYDHIISQMQAGTSSNSELSEPRRLFSRSSGLEGLWEGLYPPAVFSNIKAPPIIHAALNWVKRQMPYVDPKALLPVSIEAFKFSITCGNPSTPSLMIAECHRTNGTFGIVPARSKCDLYKQLLNLRFQSAVIRLVENPDYQGAMPDIGHYIRVRTESSSYADRIPLLYLSHEVFARVWRALKLYPWFRHSPHVGTGYNHQHSVPRKYPWKGLDEGAFVGAEINKLEYAIERRIVEAPTLELSYYVDVVGEVPAEVTGAGGIGLESYDIGNGDLPPEWGIDLVIHNGVIRYGPWADRQRVHLQRTFFPSNYHNLEVSQRLKPGDKRIWTAMKVFIELRGETSLTVPFREGSKDWQWDGQAQGPKHNKREPAFLHLTAGDSSSISYTIPMVIGPEGYESRLEVHLDTVQLNSSLNESRIIFAESCRVHAALPAPIQWNAERKWSFTVLLRQPVISPLRDHINMVVDLLRDWTSAPPTEWYQFIPTVYVFEVDLFHFDLNLYANDQNIVDKPLVKDDNTIFTLRAPRLHSVVTIPSNTYRPERSTIPLSVDVPNLAVSMSLPKWNTQSLYNLGKEQQVLHARTFRLVASYNSWSEVRSDHVDQIKLDIFLTGVSFKAPGWVVRYTLVLRDNYFGSFTHFSTLVEYLDKHRKGEVGDPIEKKYRPGQSNPLQVIISLMLHNGTLLLPAALPGYEKYGDTAITTDDVGASLLLGFSELQLDFRLHDYFMDMSLNVGEIKGCVLEVFPEDAFFRHECPSPDETLIIDGIDITTHRLFGPPPRTRTYVCVWEISFGSVRALLSVLESRIALAVLDVFRINFVDSPNAPAGEFGLPTDPDLTFVKLSVKTLNLTLLAGSAAVDVYLPHGLSVHSNDLQGQLCGKLIILRLPLANLKALITSDSSRTSWSEAAFLEFNSYLEIYSSNPNGHAQSDFIQSQDALSRRAHNLLCQVKEVCEHFRNYRTVAGYRRPLLSPIDHLKDLYLPQLSLPSFCTPTSTLQDHEQVGSSHFIRWSRLCHLSESEDEKISEAGRDARVARNRILRPAVAQSDDAELTISDEESDNEDMSDATSSGSDWLDVDAQRRSKEPLMGYHRFTRRYDGSGLNNFSARDGSPFALKPKKSSGKVPHCTLIPPTAASTISAIRMESTHGFEILITPLIIIFVSTIRDEVKHHNLSDELLLDTFMCQHLRNFTESGIPSDSVLPSFDINLHSLHVQLVEQVHCKVNLDQPSSSVVPDNGCVDLTAYCSLTGLLFKCAPQNRSANFQLDCQALYAGLSSPSGVPTASHPEYSLSLDSIQANYISGRLVICSEKLMTQIGPSDPEHIVALLLATKVNFERLAATYEDWQLALSSCFPTLVRQVLSRAKERTVVDPLSVMQPSFLVQRGLPDALRRDPHFKFLFHMRSVLRLCGPLLPANKEVPGEMDDQDLLRTCLLNIMVDVDDLTHSSLGQMMYPMEKTTTPQMALAMTSASCRIGSLRFAVLSNTPTSQSYLATTTLYLEYRSDSQAAAHLLPQDPSTSLLTSQSCIVATAANISLVVSPRLIDFAQRIVRVRKHYDMGFNRGSSASVVPSHVIVLVQVGNLDARAAAENIIFELGGSSLDLCSSALTRSDAGMDSTNHICTFGSLHVRAQSREGDTNVLAPERGSLASLTFVKGSFNVIQRSDRTSNTLRLVFSLDDIILSVPRSAIRLYRFIEEWKADFLPAFGIAAESLISEIKGNQTSLDLPASHAEKHQDPNVLFNGTIGTCNVTLQIMRGTWLSWTVRNSTAFVASVPYATTKRQRTFGLQVQSQTLAISYKSRSMDDGTEVPRVKVVLPALALTGHQGKDNVDLLAALEFANVKLKPSHWDSLLVVQQKFGRDFTDLMDLIEETRRTRPMDPEIARPESKPSRYNVQVNLKGFRIGLEGPASTFYLECENVVGGITKRGGYAAWKIALRDIALSLAPGSGEAKPEHAFDRNHKSAFIIIDVSVAAEGDRLDVSIPKIQAVMQPSSISELGDFIDHHRAELFIRRSQRTAELEAFKEKTRTILKTFEVQRRKPDLEQSTSWLSKHSITVNIERIGVAFPLSFDQSLELSMSASCNFSAVRAFLFSVRRIKFHTQRGEVGQMTTKELSFQFVNRFRQWIPMDFIAENHPTQNRLCYPEMKVQLRSNTSHFKRHIWIAGNVSGFVLDLDSSISNYVFSLVDVYRHGRERMERLASTGMAPQASESFSTSPSTESYSNALPALNMFTALVFDSGQIRIRSPSQRPYPVFGSHHDDDNYPSTREIEVVKLPVLSAWIEYRALADVPGTSGSVQAPMLIFKSKIHSSQNTLHPDLLPFVTEVTDQVQARIRKSSSRQDTQASFTSEHRDSSRGSLPSAPPEDFSPTSSLQINFSLRIDKSTLQLTCQPDVNVIAALRWESGGFIVNVSPGAHRLTFTGSVDGLTVGLKHGFLSDDCVNLAARNLAFSLAFTKVEDGEGNPEGSISVLVNTDIAGGVRFSRLQDILCSKAVWLDRIPLISEQSSNTGEPYAVPPSAQPLSPAGTQDVTTTVVLSIRRTEVTVDLGQSISLITLDLKEALVRTRFSESCSEVSLSVADVAILARGNVSGHIVVPNCIFHTVRRSEDSLTRESRESRTARLLELTMTSGALNAELDSEQQRLLVYKADPIQVDIRDDWSRLTSELGNGDRRLLLAFTVQGKEITALATITSLPKLMLYANRFKTSIASQRLAASRESEAFRATQSPKPSNPLTEVASAFFQSARNRLKEAEVELSYVIRQQMSFRLETLRLICFPRAMADVELASFIGRDVQASLHRAVVDGRPSRREIHLSFTRLNISKFSQLQPFLPPSVAVSSDRSWVDQLFKNPTEANIVGLPSMRMLMITEEPSEEPSKRLLYDFYSTFQGRADRKPEDIYITLNVALYSWLTGLRKNLSREMAQLQTQTGAAASISGVRKKGHWNTPEAHSLDTAQSDGDTITSHSIQPSKLQQPSSESSLPTKQVPQSQEANVSTSSPLTMAIVYEPRERRIQKLTLRQLGEATPDVMHPFFMKKSGFSLEDSLPQYVHEYATTPLEKIMEGLLNLYSKQLPTERMERERKLV